MKKIISIILLGIFIVSSFVIVSSDQLQQMQEEMNYIEKRINELNEQMKKEKSKQDSIASDRKYISNQARLEEEELKRKIEVIEDFEEKLQVFDYECGELEKEYEEQMEILKKRLRIMYMNSFESQFDVFIESQDLLDYFTKIEMMNYVSQRDKEVLMDISKTKRNLELKRKIAEDEKYKVQEEADESIRDLTGLQNRGQSLAQQERNINYKLNQLAKEEDKLLRKSREISAQIKLLQTSSGSYGGGSMVWPVPGHTRVSSGFGNRLHPILRVYRMHTGIDIGAPSGAHIIATNKGVVIMSGWQGGYGNAVIVDHGGGISTLYAHCSSLLVGIGDQVNAGTVIARIGSTGLSTGPHLHFEVRVNGEPVDPLKYVSNQ